MTRNHKPYDLSSLEDRKHVVAEAIAAQRLEGLEVDPDTLLDPVHDRTCAEAHHIVLCKVSTPE